MTAIINQLRNIGTYVAISEPVKITNGLGFLREIPDKAANITLTNGATTYGSCDFTIGQLPLNGVISVDWDQGIIYADPAQEGITITCSYQGKGGLFINSSRIATKFNGNTVTQTLADTLVAESNRITSENTRVSSENTRISNETTRQNNESARGWKGTYNSATSYVPSNQVTFNGTTYICILASTNNAPTNTTYWTVYASKGADGTGAGTVTNVGSANADITVGTSTTTPVLTLNSSISATPNSIVKRDGSGNIAEIGILSGLTTTDKTSMVNALNETRAGKVSLGHTDWNGSTANNPMIEIGVIGAGAALHLLCGVGMTAPYAIGIGVDNGTTTGLVASVKAGGIGIAPTLETGSTVGAIGLLGQTFGPGTLVKLVKGSQNTGAILALRADYGGTGHLLEWGVGGTANTNGYIDVDGTMTIVSPTTQNQTKFNAAAGSNNTIALYGYSGTPNLWFSNILSTGGNSLLFKQGNAAAAIGAEALSTLLELKNANAIGFFGVTPVVRPASIANSTDATNAATQLNAVISALRSLGLIT